MFKRTCLNDQWLSAAYLNVGTPHKTHTQHNSASPQNTIFEYHIGHPKHNRNGNSIGNSITYNLFTFPSLTVSSPYNFTSVLLINFSSAETPRASINSNYQTTFPLYAHLHTCITYFRMHTSVTISHFHHAEPVHMWYDNPSGVESVRLRPLSLPGRNVRSHTYDHMVEKS